MCQQLQVRVQMSHTHVDKRRRNDHARAELAQDGEGDMLGRDVCRQKNWAKNADGTGHQHDEQQADAQLDVVVAIDALACLRNLLTIGANTVLDASMEVAVQSR
jgi:hypothetical protein